MYAVEPLDLVGGGAGVAAAEQVLRAKNEHFNICSSGFSSDKNLTLLMFCPPMVPVKTEVYTAFVTTHKVFLLGLLSSDFAVYLPESPKSMAAIVVQQIRQLPLSRLQKKLNDEPVTY